MTEEQIQTEPQEEEQSALERLKIRADLLGIKYHPNIGEEKLLKKIEAKMAENELEDATAYKEQEEADKESNTKPGDPIVAAQKAGANVYTEKDFIKQQRHSKRREAGRLVRCRITCMNPQKSAWEGEIISVGSAQLGTFKKYVPFNVDSFHIPYMMYLAMKERKCSVFHTVRGPRGEKLRRARLVNEFNIQLLPPLTHNELKDLATKQAKQGLIGEEDFGI